MNSKVFKRYEKSRRHLSDRCWSILAQGLSLDVTMDTSAQADTWIEAFTVLTAQRHEPNAGAGVGAGAGAGAVAGAGAGAGVGVGASNAPADRGTPGVVVCGVWCYVVCVVRTSIPTRHVVVKQATL